jgi:retron-type reverse transcriptase
VQGAIRNVMEPIFERSFAEHSYGFGPGRGCKEALRRVQELLRTGHHWVVDLDLKSYFDTIPHDRLLERVQEQVADGRLIQMLESYLKAGVMEGLKRWEPTEEGTPQGAVISPLLANLYLNPLRARTRRTNGQSLSMIIAELNPRLRGWFGYFKHSHWTELKALDGWIRMRLRSLLRKRHKGHGPGYGHDHVRWPNAYFARQGLFCLLRARDLVAQSR